MTKPWEETWTGGIGDEPDLCDADGHLANFEGHGYDDNVETDIARARLAACAPEMARMLIDVECILVEQDGTNEKWRCTQCYRSTVVPHGEVPEEDSPGLFNHADDCGWLALMKKAGIRA